MPSADIQAEVRHAEEAGLIYVSDSGPGLSRRRRGKGFSYHDADGVLVRDDATRARIDALAIPPAYREVWICPLPHGHLQATGRDEKGRKQYRYHEKWHDVRQRAKYDRMIAFGEALPRLREQVEADLRRQGLPKEKVVALCVRLLDETLVRIGNADYARRHRHYGLTTLRDKHAKVKGDAVTFAFVGKSGQEQEVTVADRRLARLVKRCRDVPGYSLFQYKDDAGGRCTVDSAAVNAYLREHTGEDATAKFFRTWGGTVLAAQALEREGAPESDTDLQRKEAAAVRAVCEALGNTPAVCRGHYVHPDVFDAYRDGTLARRLSVRHAGNTPAGLDPAEAAVLDLLRS
jgi:DNA topoisomerase-1